MKKIKIIPILILLMILCAEHGEAVEFSLKVAGGFSLNRPAEVNGILKDWEQWQILNADRIIAWSYLSGTVSEIKTAWDLEVELLFSLSSRLAVGLSSGYIYSSISENDTSLTIAKVQGVFEVGKPTKTTAIPVILSAYYFQPLSQSLRVYFRGGGGYLWATYVERESNSLVDTERFSYSQFVQASARDMTVLLALGFLLETEPGIRFFVEGSWRQAKASGFDGEDKNGTTGTLYFLEEYDPNLDYWQGKYQISPEAPSGENFRSVKEAEIDFGGLSVKIGIMIKF